MGWEALAQGLADVLPDLPDGGLLVVSEARDGGGARYAQFAQGAAELVGYVVVNSFLDAPARASEEGERVIAGIGWRAPEPRLGHDNWWTSVPWPATAARYAELGRMVVTALRDGYGVADPDALGYQAWNEQTGEDLELPRLGLGLPKR
jgi:hypothetical protein